MELSEKDYEYLIDLIDDPSELNESLRTAIERHKQISSVKDENQPPTFYDGYRCGMKDAAKTYGKMLNEQQDALHTLYATIRRNYEELRAIIDNGSESMTHEDAVKELQRMMLEDEERSKAEPVGVAIGHHGYGAGQRVSIQWKHDYFPSIGTKFYTTPPKPVEQEPVRITDTMALSFHHALTDGACSDAEVEEIKIGLRAAFADAPVPKPDTEADIARYREVLKEN